MSSFDLTKNIRITNPVSSVDYYYGIYDSFQEALDNVPLEIRRAGRTVGIKTGNVVSEYWWNDETDLSDTGLVIKNSAGGGVLEAPLDGKEYLRRNSDWVELKDDIEEKNDITDLLSDQSQQDTQTIYQVTDASADPNLTFPQGETRLQAYYRYLGTPTGSIDDYILISSPYRETIGSGSGGIAEAPIDGNIYGRKNALWEVVEPTNWGSEEW